MPIPLHFRNDSPAGITPPNPDYALDLIGHITKHRGMKTPYTSVSESLECVKRFDGALYSVEPERVIADGHGFISHPEVLGQLRHAIHVRHRAEKVLAERAFQRAARSREAVIEWRFDLSRVKRKDRIAFCTPRVRAYFQRVHV